MSKYINNFFFILFEVEVDMFKILYYRKAKAKFRKEMKMSHGSG